MSDASPPTRPPRNSDDLVTRLRYEQALDIAARAGDLFLTEPFTLFGDAADEIERLRAQVEEFHKDWEDQLLATMYGERPGGWNSDRQDAFVARLRDAEARHRKYGCEARQHHRYPDTPEPEGDTVAFKCADCGEWVRT